MTKYNVIICVLKNLATKSSIRSSSAMKIYIIQFLTVIILHNKYDAKDV